MRGCRVNLPKQPRSDRHVCTWVKKLAYGDTVFGCVLAVDLHEADADGVPAAVKPARPMDRLRQRRRLTSQVDLLIVQAVVGRYGSRVVETQRVRVQGRFGQGDGV